MPDTIELSLNSSGRLVQSDGGETTIGNVFSRQVHWKAIDSNIASFKIVGLSRKNPWKDPMNTVPAREQHATAKFLTGTQDWVYEIEWTRVGSSTLIIADPKIVIQPIAAFDFIVPIVVGLCVAVGVLSFKVRSLQRNFRSLVPNRKF